MRKSGSVGRQTCPHTVRPCDIRRLFTVYVINRARKRCLLPPEIISLFHNTRVVCFLALWVLLIVSGRSDLEQRHSLPIKYFFLFDLNFFASSIVRCIFFFCTGLKFQPTRKTEAQNRTYCHDHQVLSSYQPVCRLRPCHLDPTRHGMCFRTRSGESHFKSACTVERSLTLLAKRRYQPCEVLQSRESGSRIYNKLGSSALLILPSIASSLPTNSLRLLRPSLPT